MPLITNPDGTKMVYPCTIIPSRYEGIYSGGNWLAFPSFLDLTPQEVIGTEQQVKAFFDKHKADAEPVPIGKGASPGDAYDNLIEKMEERYGTKQST